MCNSSVEREMAVLCRDPTFPLLASMFTCTFTLCSFNRIQRNEIQTEEMQFFLINYERLRFQIGVKNVLKEV